MHPLAVFLSVSFPVRREPPPCLQPLSSVLFRLAPPFSLCFSPLALFRFLLLAYPCLLTLLDDCFCFSHSCTVDCVSHLHLFVFPLSFLCSCLSFADLPLFLLPLSVSSALLSHSVSPLIFLLSHWVSHLLFAFFSSSFKCSSVRALSFRRLPSFLAVIHVS